MTFTTRQIKGHGRGKLLGFPTINMEIPTGMDLLEGIYAAWISIGGKTFMGALHYGPVPVFGQQTNSLEVFLLDVRDDQIGDTSSIEVDPVKRLRDGPPLPFEIVKALDNRLARQRVRRQALLQRSLLQARRQQLGKFDDIVHAVLLI